MAESGRSSSWPHSDGVPIDDLDLKRPGKVDRELAAKVSRGAAGDRGAKVSRGAAGDRAAKVRRAAAGDRAAKVGREAAGDRGAGDPTDAPIQANRPSE